MVSTGMQGGLAQRPLEWPSECQLPSSHPGQTASHDFCMQSERTYSAGALVWGWCGEGEGTCWRHPLKAFGRLVWAWTSEAI